MNTLPFSWPRQGVRLAAVALCALALAACDKPANDGGGQAAKKADGPAEFVAGSQTKMFTFALSADPQTLDPAKMSGSPEGRIAFNIFEGLLMPGPTSEGLSDPKDLVVPGVAESFEVSEDGKVYTFKLRSNAKWSNGEPLVAEDFVRSWRRVLEPGFPGDYAQILWVIAGGEAYAKGTGKWDAVGVKAPDPHTLEVTLVNPTPYFPELVAFYTFFPTPAATIEKHGDAWTRPANIVTNGPYNLASYREQQEIMLEASEHYWDKDNVKLKQARVRIITDINAVVNAYRTGELHWSGTGLPVAQITGLLAHPDYVKEPMLGIYYYRINVSDPKSPLADVRIRQALALAIDRDSLVDETLNGLYIKAESFVPPGMPGYENKTTTAYNVQKARQLMSDAGFAEGKGFPRVQLLYNTDENHKLVAESVQDMWKRNLGIDAELVNKEWKTYLQDVSAIQYEIARAGWIGDYNDPMTFLDLFVTDNGNNNTGWSDKAYDTLIAQAQAEVDTAKRTALLQQAEAILMERGPVIPIYYYTNNILVSRFIEGFKLHNRDNHLLKYLSLPGLSEQAIKE
ncbi:MAG: peptide ABC transporter substrate-binding protein [Bradymonadaceae bacterium]|nr:peptide ABC transporter substrate-binding protein [Lujinxingiaceae bacterium]